MDYQLKDILDRGLDIIYDGDWNFDRWEWKGHLEAELEVYFRRKIEKERQEQFKQQLKREYERIFFSEGFTNSSDDLCEKYKK